MKLFHHSSSSTGGGGGQSTSPRSSAPPPPPTFDVQGWIGFNHRDLLLNLFVDPIVSLSQDFSVPTLEVVPADDDGGGGGGVEGGAEGGGEQRRGSSAGDDTSSSPSRPTALRTDSASSAGALPLVSPSSGDEGEAEAKALCMFFVNGLYIIQ